MGAVSYGRALQVTRILALVLAGIYAIAALGGLLAEFDTTRDTILWVGFLLGGAALLFVGPYNACLSSDSSAAVQCRSGRPRAGSRSSGRSSSRFWQPW